MVRTIFWSWQSDQNERVTRHVIRESIVAAISRLSGEADLNERTEIDHDTKGLPGTPDIVASILEKIDAASVFIADVTPIAKTANGKQTANPNVLIELGYAKKSLGVERVITVWNTVFMNSRPEDLPFDLRGRRGPISFSLPPNAEKSELKQVRESLSSQFYDRLKACLSIPMTDTVIELPWQSPISNDPSIWIEPGIDVRINEGFGSGTKCFATGGRLYVRVLPTTFNPEVLDAGIHGPFLDGYGGFSWGHTKGGLLTYSGSVRTDAPKELTGASMWFRSSGELWLFQTGVASDYQGISTFHGDYIAEQWVDLTAQCLSKLSTNGATGPYHVVVGVTGMEGTHWPQGQTFGGAPPMALEDRLEFAFTAHTLEDDTWLRALHSAWGDLRRNFSLPKPDSDSVEKLLRNYSQ